MGCCIQKVKNDDLNNSLLNNNLEIKYENHIKKKYKDFNLLDIKYSQLVIKIYNSYLEYLNNECNNINEKSYKWLYTKYNEIYNYNRIYKMYMLTNKTIYSYIDYENKEIKPDLILIDGGKNQLNFSHAAIQNSGHKDIKVISIVKGLNRIRATETVLSKDGIIEFNKDSKGYLLLQEIRDESHRFAITAQRKKKKLSIKKSFLDEINGIGPVKKSNLLKKFKNIKNIKNAGLDELMTIRGINEKIAQQIISYKS